METIRSVAGGNFDIVTSAHLETGWGGYSFSNGEEIAQPLLKSGGIYFDANRFTGMGGGKIGDGAKVKE